MADLYFNALCRNAGRNDIDAYSAGIHAWDGSLISRQAAAVLEELNVDSSAFRSSRFTPELAKECDLLIAMTSSHKAAMEQIAPSEAAKIRLLVPEGIPDPFGGSVADYRTVFASMKPALETLFRTVAEPKI